MWPLRKEPPVGCDRPIRYIIPYRATNVLYCTDIHPPSGGLVEPPPPHINIHIPACAIPLHPSSRIFIPNACDSLKNRVRDPVRCLEIKLLEVTVINAANSYQRLPQRVDVAVSLF